jgi:hypothetical protein
MMITVIPLLNMLRESNFLIQTRKKNITEDEGRRGAVVRMGF